MLPILRFGVCRSSDLSIHVQRISLAQTHCFSLLSEPWQLFQWPIFIARKTCLAWKQSFRNTATFQILSCSCRESRFFPCPGFSPDSLVQRTSMRVREVFGGLTVSPACLACLGRAFATKAMVFSLLYARLILRTQKDLSCPAISQAKEVSYSLYIRFDCTQKLPFYLNRKGWLVGWLVGWLQESCQLLNCTL